MNLLVFGDVHLADRPPGGRVDDYTQAVLDKLGAIAKLCSDYDVQYALGTGDIFHIKQPNRVSHALVQQAISMFKSFPCEVLIVPGNHDLGPDGLASLDRQPLGTLERAGAVSLLSEIELSGEKGAFFHIAPRPYNAAAEGVHDDQTDPSYYALTQQEQVLIAKNPVPVIGLAHGSIVGPGDSRQYPYVNVDKIPGIDQYSLFISGHLHECLGIVPVGKTLFANPGSIGRTRRDIATYARTVEVLIVTIDKKGLTVKEVPLPGVAPALEVFGERPATDDPEPPSDEISRFVDTLGEGLRADELSMAELLATIDCEPRVKAEVERLLEGAA